MDVGITLRQESSLVNEMRSPSFMKKNNSYRHCPLKKRPVKVVQTVEDEPKIVIKEEITDVSQPENLSTKPVDLRQTTSKRCRSPSPVRPSSPVYIKRSESPSPVIKAQPLSPDYSYTNSIQPVAKKARVEVIQHNSSPTPLSIENLITKSALEPVNCDTPVIEHQPLVLYAWSRVPVHPPHYPFYPATYTYNQYSGEWGYTSYPTMQAAYSPDHQSVSPSPPHPSLTSPTTTTIQRPLARSYASHWNNSFSSYHCGLSPASPIGSSYIRSPPPATPEDLTSPDSDSGRSTADSISVGLNIHKGSSSNTLSSSPRYQCPDCSKSYSTYSGLSKHQQFHCSTTESQTKKTFTCKTCEKVYSTLGALKMHIRTHTLPCKCNLCGKAFSRPWLLQGHIRTHTGEKPFSCQHCNRSFADRSNLRAHLQTHSDVKKYSCSSCSRTFSRMSLLTKHQEYGCSRVVSHIPYAC